MKYCSKCGNELMDEAVICPKCGCATESSSNSTDKLLLANKKSKFATGAILNIIAGILNALFAVFFHSALADLAENPPASDANLTISSDGAVTINPIGLPIETWFYIWLSMVIIMFIIGLIIRKIPNQIAQKVCGYSYIVLCFISVGTMFEAFPNLLAAVMCIWGCVFFVPAILQIIAGIKFLQGTYYKF